MVSSKNKFARRGSRFFPLLAGLMVKKQTNMSMLLYYSNKCFLPSRKTCLYNFDPLKLQFYKVKVGLHGYTHLIFAQKIIDCWYS